MSMDFGTFGLGLGRSINKNMSQMETHLNRLSSGLRINSASDGPAMLVISEQLRSQIATLGQQIENTNLTMRKYDTASAYTSQLRTQLTEIRSLAVTAANEGVNGPEVQEAIDTTAQYMRDNYNRVLDNAEFNNADLFDGSEGSVAELDELEVIDLSTAESAVEAIEIIDTAIAELDEVSVDLGATQSSELSSTRNSLMVTRENLQQAESVIRDADYAIEFAGFMAAAIRTQASMALMAHSFGNANTILKLFSH